MIRNALMTLLLCLPVAAQLTPINLPLSSSTNTVNADFVLFQLDVTNPDGIWMEPVITSPTQPWVYDMEAAWMSRLSDQQPSLVPQFWSFPSYQGENVWEYGFVSLQHPQHIRPGSYLIAMADDIYELGRYPSPVVPVATPNTFVNSHCAVTCVGYVANAAVNPLLQEPPFSALLSQLQPCDLVGWLPFSVYSFSGVPYPHGASWVAGAQEQGCTGRQASFGGQTWTGPFGVTSRWLMTRTNGALDKINASIWRGNALVTGGPTLPIGALGVVNLHLGTTFDDPVVRVDLSATGLLSRGGYVRMPIDVLVPLDNLFGGSIFEWSIIIPPGSVGLSVFAQATILDQTGDLHVTDLYAFNLY